MIFTLESCLIGLAIRPAAVKKATKVSASRDMPNWEPKAKKATSDSDIETSIWIIGVARFPVASSFKFWFLFEVLAIKNLLFSYSSALKLFISTCPSTASEAIWVTSPIAVWIFVASFFNLFPAT